MSPMRKVLRAIADPIARIGIAALIGLAIGMAIVQVIK